MLRQRLTQFVTRTTFRQEVILVVAIKIMLIFLIWGFFFSHPISKHLGSPELSQRFLDQS